MIPGIDSKIDIAFRKVFGSEPWRDLTASLINAVLEAAPPHRVVDVELLNPYSEKMTLDDKLSILDIKAMGVLKMLAQNDMERELYEGRLKARRDLQTLEK